MYKDFKIVAEEASRQILEAPLYTAGIALYRFGVRVAGLSNPKARKLDKGQRDIWNRLETDLHPGDRVIWVHAASLGEFEQGRPLIEKIRASHPEFKILLTFFSPSGYEVRNHYEGADCVCYLPFDTPARVRRFIDTVRPEMAIFVKYEIWRNYLHELYARGIPTYLISAAFRPDQYFFRHRGSWYGMWLKWYTRIFVQDRRSRELLESIHVHNVEVCGDTRFDRVSQIHEFDTHRLDILRSRFANGAVLLSEMRENPEAAEGKQVLIIDCFGLLSSAYAYCDTAYVGGGFGAGLHNINEAAVYDIPVIYGPNNKKFIEAHELAECGGGVPVSSEEEFIRAADSLLLSAAERERRGRLAGEYIRSKIGATDRIYDALGFAR